MKWKESHQMVLTNPIWDIIQKAKNGKGKRAMWGIISKKKLYFKNIA